MTCRCYHWFEIIQHSRSAIEISILKIYNKIWSIISIRYRYFFHIFLFKKTKDKTEVKEHRQCSNVLITYVYIFSLVIISPFTLKNFKIMCPTFHLENPILDMQYCCADVWWWWTYDTWKAIAFFEIQTASAFCRLYMSTDGNLILNKQYSC